MAEQMHVDPLERRLLEWGAWVAGQSSRVSGYPCTSVLHPSWSPPTRGSTPTMATASGSTVRERHTDRLVRALSKTLQNTLAVVYVRRVPPAERAALLQCQPSTVPARVREAKHQIRAMLDAEAKRQD